MKFDDWNAELFNTCGNFQGTRREGREEVEGHFSYGKVCGLDLADIACDIDRIDRTLEGIRRDDLEYIYLVAPLRGGTLIEQEGRRAMLRPGNLCLVDSTRAVSIRFSAPAHLLSVHLPRASTLLGSQGLEIGGEVRDDGVASRQLRRYLGDWIGRRKRTPAGNPEYLLTLVRGAFSRDGSSGGTGATAPCRDTRLELAVREMEVHLCDAELTLRWLASRIGISERQLERDFQNSGSGFVRHLRIMRLKLATELIERSILLGRSARITDIALASGFRDLSNFNRAFRAAFGCTPRDYVARARELGLSMRRPAPGAAASHRAR